MKLCFEYRRLFSGHGVYQNQMKSGVTICRLQGNWYQILKRIHPVCQWSWLVCAGRSERIL